MQRMGRCVAPVIKVLVEAAALDDIEAKKCARPVQAGQQAGNAAGRLAASVVDLKIKALQEPHAAFKE
eukprot:scaffold88404_cov72-Phaeocystis_antarctica.AAC.2